MKTVAKSILAIAAIAFFLITTHAQAHDLVPPDFRGLPATVFGEFEFGNPANPASPTQGDWVEGPSGESLFPEKPPRVSFSESDFVWNQGGEGGAWTATDNGVVEICIPNIVDDFPAKYIRIQVTWSFNGPSDPPILMGVFGEDAEDGPLTDVKVVNTGTRGIGGLTRHSYYDIRVEPNPDWEVIELGVQAGMRIHQIVIDTISVPLSEHDGADDVEIVHGVPVFGVWGFTQESDDQYFGIRLARSRPSGSTESNFPRAEGFRSQLPHSTLLIRDFWMPQENEVLAVLALRIEVRGTVPGLKQTVQMFNWRTNKFDNIGSDVLSMEDVVYEYELLNFADYVEPTTGETRAILNTHMTSYGFPLPNTVLDWIDFKRELDLYGDE